MKSFLASVILILLLAATLPSWGNQQGPIKPPPPDREVKRIPTERAPEAPPIPVEEIIRQVTEHENEFIRARNASTYQASLRLQEFDDNNEAVGEYQMTKDILFNADGKPYEKVLRSAPSTLTHLALPAEELAAYAHIRAFMLPTVSLEFYDLTFAGKQPLDELSTYMFKVSPKRLSRTHHYFEGVIWVDDRDLAIVKTYGKWVSEVEQKTGFEPFVLFECYRENVAPKTWFPSFIRSEENFKSDTGSARLRLTIRFTNYKLAAEPAKP
jgi:hypothetical protein